MIKVPALQEDKTVLNVCVPNSGASKCTWQTILEKENEVGGIALLGFKAYLRLQ